MYTRAQNVNRPDHGGESSSSGPPQKRAKADNHAKHTYPVIPSCADDDEANKRNLQLLKEESLKTKPRSEVIKELLTRTYPARRGEIVNSSKSVADITNDITVLKKCTYVSRSTFRLSMFYVERSSSPVSFGNEVHVQLIMSCVYNADDI